MPTRHLLWAFVACATLHSSSRALAQQSDLELQARAHFQSGTAYFDTGDYAAAAREFLAAYERSPRPALLYNIYAAYERLGELGEAVSYLERFLATGDNIQNRAALEARLTTLRERHAAREAERQAEAQRAEQERAERTRAEAERAEAERRAQAAEESARAREDSSGGSSTGAYVVLGVAGAAAVTSGVFAVLTLMKDGDLAESCGADAGRTCSDDDVSALETNALIADVSLGVAVVAGAIGLVMLLGGGDDEEATAGSARLSPWVGPNGGGAVVRGAF